MNSDRPNPDALLAQFRESDQAPGTGRLKIYLGMAAGVGKTYGMLADGQAAVKRGHEVVIGYLEPHGRVETESQADGLERIPLKLIEHKGVTLKEFDLDAALTRRPEIILVDELAHTNAPGSRHKKRWQDVEELLSAGINVYTTVNVQHLESLNDVVAQITGVIVAETIPDDLLGMAAEVELVDIPPDELIQRLREGKIYVPEKVDQALGGFFRKRNLVSLREIALRRMADQVDAQVRNYRAAEGATAPWHTSERILVCVAPNKMANRVVRSAARMSNTLHAKVVAVYIESSRQSNLPPAQKAMALEALQLAEHLGAETATLNGEDMVRELLQYANTHNVTTIVVGKPIKPRWKELLFGSFVDAMVRSSGDIDVHVITGAEQDGTRNELPKLKVERDWSGYVLAIGVVAVCTILGAITDPIFNDSATALLFLLGVVVVASRSSRSAAFLASLLNVLAFNFFFTAPRYSFNVQEPQNLFVFAVMLIVGVAISTLTARLKAQTVAASTRERRSTALYELSRQLSSTRSRTEIGTYAAEQVRQVFGCDVAVLIKRRRTNELFSAPSSKTGFELGSNEVATSKWVVEYGKRAGVGTDTLPGADGLYLPLNSDSGCLGVLAVKAEGLLCQDPAQIHLLETFANQLAIAVERTNLAKDSNESTLQVERERLRNTLLSSVSHDLRTPLAVISGAAGQLAVSGHLGVQEQELAQSIVDESGRLERQVRNLLDMTKLEAGTLKLNLEWQSLEELVGSALQRTEAILGSRVIDFHLPVDFPLLRLDGGLFEQVLINLFENTAKHTPDGTTASFSARVLKNVIEIEFTNRGPLILAGQEEKIFEKFSRGDDAVAPGTGLGLAIVRAIIEAHWGKISASNLEHGVRFLITLPLPNQSPKMPREIEEMEVLNDD